MECHICKGEASGIIHNDGDDIYCHECYVKQAMSAFIEQDEPNFSGFFHKLLDTQLVERVEDE